MNDKWMNRSFSSQTQNMGRSWVREWISGGMESGNPLRKVKMSFCEKEK